MTPALYDHLAAAFHRQTGVMAPGKDAPPGLYTEAQDVARFPRWIAWVNSAAGSEARERFEDDLRDAHAEWLEEASGMTADEAREQEDR